MEIDSKSVMILIQQQIIYEINLLWNVWGPYLNLTLRGLHIVIDSTMLNSIMKIKEKMKFQRSTLHFFFILTFHWDIVDGIKSYKWSNCWSNNISGLSTNISSMSSIISRSIPISTSSNISNTSNTSNI